MGVVSANLTPDSTGKPHGLTLQQFEIALRTGHDPLDPKFGLLAVMPWPYFRHMTRRDLEAIYAFLSAIPSGTPGSCQAAGALDVAVMTVQCLFIEGAVFCASFYL